MIWKKTPMLKNVLASSKGTLQVKKYKSPMPNGGFRFYGGYETKGQWNNKKYIYVYKGKTYSVARLICSAFHGSPPNKNSVCMHLDENARNNKPENLKWGTQKENLNFPKFLLYCKSRTGKNSPTYKHREKKNAERKNTN